MSTTAHKKYDLKKKIMWKITLTHVSHNLKEKNMSKRAQQKAAWVHRRACPHTASPYSVFLRMH